jgi:hypothetical protein
MLPAEKKYVHRVDTLRSLRVCFLITNVCIEDDERLTSASTKDVLLRTVIGALSESTRFKCTLSHPLLDVGNMNAPMEMRDEIEFAPTFLGHTRGLHSRRRSRRSEGVRLVFNRHPLSTSSEVE